MDGYQFGGEATALNWVEVAHFFWNIHHTHNLDGKVEFFVTLKPACRGIPPLPAPFDSL